MKLTVIFLSILGFIAAPRLIGPPAPPVEGVQPAVDYFTAQSQAFAASCTQLRQAVEVMISAAGVNGTANITKQGSLKIAAARQRLLECRYHYKHIESF